MNVTLETCDCINLLPNLVIISRIYMYSVPLMWVPILNTVHKYVWLQVCALSVLATYICSADMQNICEL